MKLPVFKNWSLWGGYFLYFGNNIERAIPPVNIVDAVAKSEECLIKEPINL